jgi:hypothetical protein
MKQTYKRKVGATSIPGLYIEIKEPAWYLSTYNIDLAKAVFDVL